MYSPMEPGKGRHRYRFVIDDAYTPETLPMARLAEYMIDMAKLLGETESVHFVGVEAGSSVLVQDVESEAQPKVRERVHAVRLREAPREAVKAYEALNQRLTADNATGALLEDSDHGPPARILDFPGAAQVREEEIEYGPVAQEATLQGVVIMVGGENDPVSVHLQDNDIIHICRAKRSVAQKLAQHIFDCPVRVSGKGRWLRRADGTWDMRVFNIDRYEQLQDDPLDTVVTELRETQGNWQVPPDTLRVLRSLRRED